jgi:hypothetical protein
MAGAEIVDGDGHPQMLEGRENLAAVLDDLKRAFRDFQFQLASQQAVFSTQCPSGMMMPFSSAIEMKRSGGIKPFSVGQQVIEAVVEQQPVRQPVSGSW